MNIQTGKTLHLFSTLCFLIFTLFTSVTMVDAQRKRKTPRRTTPPVKIQPLPKRQEMPLIKQFSLPELVRRVKPSVVSIYVFDKNDKHTGSGSAFFIAPRRVVTNFHVVEGCHRAEIHTNDGFAYRVSQVSAFDSKADLALLEVEIPADVEIRPLLIARQSIKEGEDVIVIGNPQGLEGTVSQGIVSAIRQTAAPQSYLQITAPLSLGSSGGPVMNMRGEIVGIATFQLNQGQNLNFAISSSSLDALNEHAERRIKAVRFYEDGIRLFRGGNHNRALEMFAQALKIFPDYTAAWLETGNAHLAIDDAARAQFAYGEAIRLEPNNAEALYNSGIAYAKQGLYADAINRFRQVIAVYPNSAETYVATGNAYYHLNNIRSAIDSYKQAIRIRSNDADANYYLGLAYLAQGERKSARKQVKKLQQLGASEMATELSQKIPR